MSISIELLQSLVEGLTNLLQPGTRQEEEGHHPLPPNLAAKVFVPPPRLSHPVFYTAKQLLVRLIQEKEPPASQEGRGVRLEKGRPILPLPPAQGEDKKRISSPIAQIQQTAEELVIEVKQAIRLLPLFLAQPKPEELHKTLGRLKPLIDTLIAAVERGETAIAGEGEKPLFAKPEASLLAKRVATREIAFPKTQKPEPVVSKKIQPTETVLVKDEKVEQVKSQHISPTGSALKTEPFVIFDRTAISAAPFSPNSSIDRREKKKKNEKYWLREEEEKKEETP